MILRFRPLFGFTALMVPMFALLVGLGFWQLERLQWKLGLIAEMDKNTHAAPIPIDRALVMGIASAQYRRVEMFGRFLNDRESYVFGTGPRGFAVYHVLTPLVLDDGRIFLVDRGIVPLELRLPAKRSTGELNGEQRVFGVLRTPDKPGPFTPAPDLAKRIWFARDVAGIAAADHVHLASPMIVEADASPNPGGWPRGGQTVVALPNDHLQYAITWFLLAAALVVIYFAYHRARGRLTV
ncbi:MAG: SURF1 family protein [Rhizomicrobium sp.]|jgi:surfeit locus 1 family protein